MPVDDVRGAGRSWAYISVMTKSPPAGEGRDGGAPGAAGHCAWCRRALPARKGPGRPRRFCSARCRQWDWVAHQRASELELSEGELVIAREQLDELHDELYVLACAVDDVERDLAASRRRTVTELTDAVHWLLDAARPLRDREIGPSAPPRRP